MSRSSGQHGSLLNLPLAVVFGMLLSACQSGGVKPVDLFAPVPEAPRRMEYDVDPALLEGATFDAFVDRLVTETTCLLRTDRPGECQQQGASPSVCNIDRTEEQITLVLRPSFEALLSLKLESPFSINNEVRAKVPNMISTTEVWDARRATVCREWRSDDGACVAAKVDKAWVLLHAPADGDGTIDHLEIFAAEPVCAEDL